MRSLPLLLGAALTGAVARSQALAWNVPHRGALVYERTTERFAVTPPPGRLRLHTLIAGGGQGGHAWRYLACGSGAVPADFADPAFDDSEWRLGSGEFGGDVGSDPRQRTDWRTAELCLRTRVDLGRRKPRALLLRVGHDDTIRVHVGGRPVLASDRVARGADHVLMGDVLDALPAGETVVAVQCTNTGGAQFLDVELVALPTLPPGVRTAEDVLAELRAAREGAARVERELFGPFRPPPMLLQGELDAKGQHVRVPPSDLREIGWWVATDLQRGTAGGTWQLESPRMHELGDLRLRCRAGAVDAGGWQEIEVRLETAPEVDPRGDGNRFVDRYVAPHVRFGFAGGLRVRRLLGLDGARARVLAFRTELEGQLLQGEDRREPAAVLAQVEQWKFARAHDNQDAGFRAAVAEALRRGTASLRRRLRDTGRGSLDAEPADGDRSYHSGRLAIGLLALIKGGVPLDDPVLRAGMDELRRRALIDTYSLGNALMAFEAFHAPANEFADLKTGVIDRPRRREVPREDLELMQGWTDRLLSNVDTRVDAAYLLRFNYVAGARFDHSVNQYGLLGLFSAHLCGVRIPATTWEAAANHLIAAQCRGGERLDLDLCDYRTLLRMQADPEHRRTVTRLPVRPAGWNYGEPRSGGEDTPSWGAMVCAGITGLAICEAALLDLDLQRVRLRNDAAAARNAAFGWLAEHLTVRHHPGAIFRQQRWLYYYLYGLERAALLSGVALIQDRDWYFEGALMLVQAQLENGQWPAELHHDLDVERDAMAILFLKQGTLPVLTGR